ncbi:MAG: hypothetical protein U0984_09395, partial [Prosthecobacter sp.]|nr:hypothetical protein [Prosthecobacter sp.]
MVIHASNEFKKRFRCKLSLQGQPVVQSGRLDAWSGHFIRLGTTQMALMMNDATLWSLILPAKGLFNISDLLKVFLPRVAELWR